MKRFPISLAALLLLSACGTGEGEANNQAGVPIGDGLSVNALAANEAAVLPETETDNSAVPEKASEGEGASTAITPAPPPPKSAPARDEPAVKSAPKPPPPPARQEDDPHAGHETENQAD